MKNKARGNTGVVAYVRRQRPTLFVWLYAYGLVLVFYYLFFQYLWKVISPTNTFHLVDQIVNGGEQRIDIHDMLLSTQRLHKNGRVIMRREEFESAANVTSLYHKRTLEILVFFPIQGLDDSRRQNEKMDIERYVIEAWNWIADVENRVKSARPTSLRIVAFAESAEQCYPDFQGQRLSASFTCLPLPAECIHPDFHIPTMNCIFSTAQDLATPSELLFYANSDIIFHPDTISAISSILEEFDEEERVAIVGQRTEIDYEALSFPFSSPGLQEVFAHAECDGVLYSPYGLDYFIMTPGTFPHDYPPYLLGRWRWDSALLADLVVTNDVATGEEIISTRRLLGRGPLNHAFTPFLGSYIIHTVDATQTILAIHVGITTDFTPEHYSNRVGSTYNDEMVNQKLGEGYFLGRTDNTHFVQVLDDALLYRVLPRITPANMTEVIPLRRGIRVPAHALHKERSLVQLVLVYPGEASEALKLACIAVANNNGDGLPPHITFLAFDEKSYQDLEARYPNAVIYEPMDSVNLVENERLDSQRMARKAVRRLVKDKATVVLVEASNPHWSMGRVEEPSRMGKVIDGFVRTCDITLFDTDLFSVRPTSGGLRYLEFMEWCESSESRSFFLENVANLSADESQFFAGSMNACLKGLKDGAVIVESEDFQQVSVCEIDEHMPSPSPLSRDISQGRLWTWDTGKQQCTIRRQEETVDSETRAMRSVISRATPVDDTLHVIVAVSNPCGLTSRYTLAEKTIAQMEMDAKSSTTIYVVEIAYGDEPFRLTNQTHSRHLQLRTPIPLWHKENMVNLAAEKLLPRNWKAVAWVDGDVEFDNPSWALDTLKLLNGHKDVIQLFSHAVFMDATKNTQAIFTGYAYNFVRGREYEGTGNDLWHPGFGWAYSRAAFDQAGGLYEREISGHGDGVIAHCMKGSYDWDSYYMKFSSQGHRDAILAYNASCGGLRMGYTPGVVRHLYHGNYADRKYVERRLVFDEFHFDPKQHVERDGESGVLVPSKTFPENLLGALKESCYKKTDDGDLSLFIL